MVLRDLCGAASSAESGECSQTGQEFGRVDRQSSQIVCSQQGNLNAFAASLLQMAHFSFAGMSSGLKVLLYSSVLLPPECVLDSRQRWRGR